MARKAPPEPDPPAAALTRIYAWFSAVIAEDTDLLDDLIAHGIQIDATHPLRHTTALMEATRLGRTALALWLLARGASPAFLCGLPKGTPLHCALLRHHWDIAEALIDAGGQGQCNIVDSHGRTPMHVMCMDMPQNAEVILIVMKLAEKLMGQGCQLDALDNEGITALHYCVINDCKPMAHLLLEWGANPNSLTPDTHVSPLAIAALEKNTSFAQLLLQYGANPNAPTKEGSTPLTIMPSLKSLTAETIAVARVDQPN